MWDESSCHGVDKVIQRMALQLIGHCELRVRRRASGIMTEEGQADRTENRQNWTTDVRVIHSTWVTHR